MADGKAGVTLDSLDTKLGDSVDRLDAKVDAAVGRLDTKIDSAVERLDTKIDSAVEQLDTKIDTQTDETKRHAMVLFEATRGEIRQVADVVASMNEKLDRVTGRIPKMESDVDLLKVAYGDLDRRVTRLEDTDAPAA
ncbi:MAG: hypothetical protein QGI10_17810 [Vicinamibacterales bacterium]|jgi:chromosome segregation ATPase|nr:hypothetical protein [Vicinamibacterales bacterium]MDP7690288.1 hypothetical protein [Vicinamibacterales bacterium]